MRGVPNDCTISPVRAPPRKQLTYERRAQICNLPSVGVSVRGISGVVTGSAWFMPGRGMFEVGQQ